MKKFFDRLAYYFHRPRLFNKFAIVVSTTASTGLKEVIDYISLNAKGWGFNLLDRIGVVSNLYFDDYESFDPKYHNLIDKRIERAVKKIVISEKEKQNISPDLFSMALFLAMKEKAKKLKADYEYWQEKGWFKAKYYYTVKFGLFKSMVYLFLKNMIIPFIVK